jgi:tRNA pseudouridine55 synthase
MNGLLLVDKPQGWTSFDVVNKVRRIVAAELGKKPKNTKVGHTGTLDPLATGLLVLVLGDYCKRAQEFSKLDKIYEVTMYLGVTSTTGDEEGVKTPISDRQPGYEEVEDALKPIVGDIMQIPPNFSAIKVNGKRAYDLARAGKEVKLEARPVTIHSIKLTEYIYPEAKFTARVGSGTYIRSLVEDVGRALETGAYMSGLSRTTVGQWRLDKAISMENIDIATITENLLTP